MDFDVVVVGGGLAGASLAVCLRKAALKVAVVEGSAPTPPDGWDARIYAISPANRDFLDQLGIWKHLDPTRITPVAEMAVHGDAGGELGFSAYESGMGELAWIVESSLMLTEFWETLKRQHNVSLFCPATPSEITFGPDAATLTLSDGVRLRSRLVVAADGANSWVRRQAGIDATVTPYDETGIVANFRCSTPHREIAHQWFRDDGVLAWLPLPGNRISVVWSTPNANAEQLLALDEEAFCATVAAAGGHSLGALSLETRPAGFPLRLLRVAETVRPRLALIGDAAHAIHPLSGHGINLGFQDAMALGQRLAALPAWRDPGELSVLRAYARARAEEPLLVQYTTHALNRLFKGRNPVLTSIRNAGMNLTGHLPVLKSMLIRYAISGKF